VKLLFVADPLASFKIYKDSTFAMMREALAAGHEVWACEADSLVWQQDDAVRATAQRIEINASTSDWWAVKETACEALSAFDATIMRKDPPFDMAFLYATHLLSQAEREGARVFNRPQAIREHPEKLAILEFPALIAPTLVSADMAALRAFHHTHGDVILKPLDGMGGAGIFRVKSDGLNLGSIVETLTNNGQTTIMVQRYLPAIAQGDKRVLLIDGQPVPYALARIPQGNEVRGNLAAGGLGVAQALSESDLRIANTLGPILAARGLFLVGLDIIGEHLTEINVTSPTCFQEITQQTGHDVAAQFMRALEHHVSSTPS
jgi:glutathione synthase